MINPLKLLLVFINNEASRSTTLYVNNRISEEIAKREGKSIR